MPRYLVVDDSPTVREAVVRCLKQVETSPQITEAGDARSAVESFEKSEPDVTFLDLMLPDSSGVEVLGKVLARNSSARVVVLTGLPDDDQAVIAALSAGAMGYVRKPVRLEAIRDVLEVLASESGWQGRIR